MVAHGPGNAESVCNRWVDGLTVRLWGHDTWMHTLATGRDGGEHGTGGAKRAPEPTAGRGSVQQSARAYTGRKKQADDAGCDAKLPDDEEHDDDGSGALRPPPLLRARHVWAVDEVLATVRGGPRPPVPFGSFL